MTSAISCETTCASWRRPTEERTVRVPVSWLNLFLSRELTAREVDDLLGEAGVTVTGLAAIGAWSSRVVAARVEAPAAAPGQVCVALPTSELATLPPGTLPPPAPETMVAVALPGATLFADLDRPGLVRVPPSGRPGQAVGRVCTAAELGLDGQAGIHVLALGAVPGEPVAGLIPRARREEVLTLRIPDVLAHCGSLSGLAREINNRLGHPAPRPETTRPAPLARANGAIRMQVTVPGLAACAVLFPAPASDAESAIDWRLPSLAGLEAGSELDRALLIAAFEHGAHLSAHLMPADAPVAIRIGPGHCDAGHADAGHADAALHVTPEPLQRPPGDGQARILVVATSSADLAGGVTGCQQAAERVFRLLSPGSDAPSPLAALASGPQSARQHIALDPAEIAAKTGLAIEAGRCRDLLCTIGARSRITREGLLQVAVPPARPDLKSGDDLVAELIRLLGFTALPSTVPEDPVRPQPDHRYQALAAIRQVLASLRFYEVITPLVAENAEPGTGGGQDAPWSAGSLPLATGKEVSPGWLRSSLVPGLAQASLSQVPPGKPHQLYELGSVVAAGSAPATERCHLAVLRSAPVVPADPWPAAWEEEYWGVLDAAKAAVLALGVGEPRASAVEDSRFYPGTGAVLSISGQVVGCLGALLPAALAPLATRGVRLVAAELDLDFLLSLPRQPRELPTPPRFPVSQRDISLILPDGVPAWRVLDAVGQAGPLLRSAEISAVYRDPRVPDAPRVVTVRLILGSPWRTLRKQEAATAVERATLAARSVGAIPR
jgi:phenylalanyl-tRNA synthetase beta subunit